jgi:hypothetical protein
VGSGGCREGDGLAEEGQVSIRNEIGRGICHDL